MNCTFDSIYVGFFYCVCLCVCVCCYGYSLAVFVGWFVVVDWNSSLIFTLHQLITILSHELTKHTHTKRDRLFKDG